jgi:hypothetical protein
LLGIIFDPEDGGSKFLRNVAEFFSYYTLSDPRRFAAVGKLKSNIDNIKVFRDMKPCVIKI